MNQKKSTNLIQIFEKRLLETLKLTKLRIIRPTFGYGDFHRKYFI